MSANAICYFSSDKDGLKEVIDLGLEVSICRASLVFFVVLHECISLIRHIIHSECTLYEGFLMVCSAWGGCRPFISVAGRSQHRQGTVFFILLYYFGWLVEGGSPPLGEWRWVGKGACGGFTFDKCVYRKSWLWCMAMISDRLKAVIGSVSPPLSCWWAANIWGMAFMRCPLKTWSTQQEI